MTAVAVPPTAAPAAAPAAATAKKMRSSDMMESGTIKMNNSHVCATPKARGLIARSGVKIILVQFPTSIVPRSSFIHGIKTVVQLLKAEGYNTNYVCLMPIGLTESKTVSVCAEQGCTSAGKVIDLGEGVRIHGGCVQEGIVLLPSHDPSEPGTCVFKLNTEADAYDSDFNVHLMSITKKSQSGPLTLTLNVEPRHKAGFSKVNDIYGRNLGQENLPNGNAFLKLGFGLEELRPEMDLLVRTNETNKTNEPNEPETVLGPALVSGHQVSQSEHYHCFTDYGPGYWSDDSKDTSPSLENEPKFNSYSVLTIAVEPDQATLDQEQAAAQQQQQQLQQAAAQQLQQAAEAAAAAQQLQQAAEAAAAEAAAPEAAAAERAAAAEAAAQQLQQLKQATAQQLQQEVAPRVRANEAENEQREVRRRQQQQLIQEKQELITREVRSQEATALQNPHNLDLALKIQTILSLLGEHEGNMSHDTALDILGRSLDIIHKWEKHPPAANQNNTGPGTMYSGSDEGSFAYILANGHTAWGSHSKASRPVNLSFLEKESNRRFRAIETENSMATPVTPCTEQGHDEILRIDPNVLNSCFRHVLPVSLYLATTNTAKKSEVLADCCKKGFVLYFLCAYRDEEKAERYGYCYVPLVWKRQVRNNGSNNPHGGSGLEYFMCSDHTYKTKLGKRQNSSDPVVSGPPTGFGPCDTAQLIMLGVPTKNKTYMRLYWVDPNVKPEQPQHPQQQSHTPTCDDDEMGEWLLAAIEDHLYANTTTPSNVVANPESTVVQIPVQGVDEVQGADESSRLNSTDTFPTHCIMDVMDVYEQY